MTLAGFSEGVKWCLRKNEAPRGTVKSAIQTLPHGGGACQHPGEGETRRKVIEVKIASLGAFVKR